jgi:hypothetical protein
MAVLELGRGGGGAYRRTWEGVTGEHAPTPLWLSRCGQEHPLAIGRRTAMTSLYI